MGAPHYSAQLVFASPTHKLAWRFRLFQSVYMLVLSSFYWYTFSGDYTTFVSHDLKAGIVLTDYLGVG